MCSIWLRKQYLFSYRLAKCKPRQKVQNEACEYFSYSIVLSASSALNASGHTSFASFLTLFYDKVEITIEVVHLFKIHKPMRFVNGSILKLIGIFLHCGQVQSRALNHAVFPFFGFHTIIILFVAFCASLCSY